MGRVTDVRARKGKKVNWLSRFGKGNSFVFCWTVPGVLFAAAQRGTAVLVNTIAPYVRPDRGPVPWVRLVLCICSCVQLTVCLTPTIIVSMSGRKKSIYSNSSQANQVTPSPDFSLDRLPPTPTAGQPTLHFSLAVRRPSFVRL